MSWNDGLSPEQETVANHIGSHGRLLAGPGTGKTRTMTSRVAYLIEEQDVPASDILALTFTRAAASELKNRVTLLLEEQVVPQVSTLHSFALRSILLAGAGNRLPSPIRIADDYEERWIIEEDIKRILDLDRVDQARDLISLLSADWETLAADAGDWAQRFPNPQFLGAWNEHRKIYGYTLRAELVYQLKRALEEGAVEQAEAGFHQRPPAGYPQGPPGYHKDYADYQGGAHPKSRPLESPEIVQGHNEADAREREEGHRGPVLPQPQPPRTVLVHRWPNYQVLPRR